MDEVANVIQGHHDHDRAASGVDRGDPGAGSAQRFSWMNRGLMWTSSCTSGSSPIALKL